jgi:shikimate kinase
MKTLFILIGLKGSGKTFIGKLIEDKFNIPFLRVENIFKNIKRDRHFADVNYIKEGFELLEIEIRSRFEKDEALTMESTGLTDEFMKMLGNLRKDFSVKLIKINADPKLCFKRVKERNSRDHINVSDSDAEHINKLAMEVKFEYNLVIDNNLETEPDLADFKTLTV